jgi:hypothetical protein
LRRRTLSQRFLNASCGGRSFKRRSLRGPKSTETRAGPVTDQDLGLQYQLENVTDVVRYAEFGIMFTPALVVDGVVKPSGRVPSLDGARRLLG